MAAALLAFWAAAIAMPSTLRVLAAKEGPLEHVSHVVLLMAVVAWAAAAVRRRGQGPAALLWAVAGFCAVVLLEELDWGAVYGVSVVADRLSAATGRPDFHNAWGGASYVLFAAPLLVLVVPAVVRRGAAVAWLRGQLGDRVPRPGEVVAIGVVVAGSVIGTLAVPAWERELDEVVELLVYGWLLGVGGRR